MANEWANHTRSTAILKVHLNDDRDSARLVTALRQHAVDTLTCGEAAIRSASDNAQLAFATERGRVVISQDRGGSRRFHTARTRNRRVRSGIIIVAQKRQSPGEVARAIPGPQMLRPAQEMRGLMARMKRAHVF
jgi:hypothetical protein